MLGKCAEVAAEPAGIERKRASIPSQERRDSASSRTVDRVALEKLQHAIVSQINAQHDRLREELAELLVSTQERCFRQWGQEVVVDLQQALLDKANEHDKVSEQVGELALQQQEREADVKLAARPAPQSVQKDAARAKMFSNYEPAVALPIQPEPPPPKCPGPDDEPDGTKLEGPASEFQGRPNLHAFLQAKHWSSDAAEYPDEDYTPELQVGKGLLARLCPKVRRAIISPTFDLLIGAVIMLNSVVMALELEYEGIFSADAIGIDRDEGGWPHAEQAFEILEHIFAVVFLLELILRFLVMGCAYFKQPLNIMDFVIVAVSMVELYISALLGVLLPDMSSLKLLRVLKIVRVLRILRVLKFFGKLRTLVSAVVCSMPSLGWAMCLLGIIQLIGSIFMTLSLQSYLKDDSEDAEQRAQVYTFFGSFTRSAITLFEMTLAVGTWGRVGRVVIFSVSRNYALFFLGYMAFVSFAVIRVIAAIFLKDTLTASTKDSEVQMAQEHRSPDYVKRIRSVFNDMDYSKTGTLTLQDVDIGMHDEGICARLASLGISTHEVKGLFTLMDDGDDEVQFAEFLTGIMRLKNSSKGVDLATLLYENKKILKRVLSVDSKVKLLREQLGGTTTFDADN